MAEQRYRSDSSSASQGSSLSPSQQSSSPYALGRSGQDSPFSLLHERMNRVFDDFMGPGFGLGFPSAFGTADLGFGGSSTRWPNVDVSYDPERVHIAAELPGLEEKDVKLSVDRGQLVLSGERRSETSDSAKNWSRRERTWGSFQRVIPLPDDVQSDKAEARFNRGLLLVDIPRKVDERNRPRQIPISKS